GALTVDFADAEGVHRRARLELPARADRAAPRPDAPSAEIEASGVERAALAADAPPGMHVEPARHLPKRFVFWAVDTLRAVPWIGPAPIAWLEDRVFGLRDDVRQL